MLPQREARGTLGVRGFVRQEDKKGPPALCAQAPCKAF